MPGEFELKKSKDGHFMFNLKAANNLIILTSEIYMQKVSAENGIDSVRKNALREGAFETKTNIKGEPFFILKATNGQEIGRSENYSSKAALENGIESVKKMHPTPRLWMSRLRQGPRHADRSFEENNEKEPTDRNGP